MPSDDLIDLWYTIHVKGPPVTAVLKSEID